MKRFAGVQSGLQLESIFRSMISPRATQLHLPFLFFYPSLHPNFFFFNFKYHSCKPFYALLSSQQARPGPQKPLPEAFPSPTR